MSTESSTPTKHSVYTGTCSHYAVDRDRMEKSGSSGFATFAPARSCACRRRGRPPAQGQLSAARGGAVVGCFSWLSASLAPSTRGSDDEKVLPPQCFRCILRGESGSSQLLSLRHQLTPIEWL